MRIQDLDKNIVRINGYINGKKRHVDIIVKDRIITVNGIECTIPRIPHYTDIPQIGFENGLEAVTSYNYYNWVSEKRYTERVW